MILAGAASLVKLILLAIEYTYFIDAKCVFSANSSHDPNDSYLYYIGDKLIQTGGYDHVVLVGFTTVVSVLSFVEYVQLGWGRGGIWPAITELPCDHAHVLYCAIGS